MLYNALSLGKKTPKSVPFPWDFVTLREEDRATAIRNMHKKLVKIACVAPEIDTQTHTRTDVLITILGHRNGSYECLSY